MSAANHVLLCCRSSGLRCLRLCRSLFHVHLLRQRSIVHLRAATLAQAPVCSRGAVRNGSASRVCRQLAVPVVVSSSVALNPGIKDRCELPKNLERAGITIGLIEPLAGRPRAAPRAGPPGAGPGGDRTGGVSCKKWHGHDKIDK